MECKICNSERLNLFFRGSKRDKENESVSFSPTSSGFGLFYNTFVCKKCGFMFSEMDIKEEELNHIYSNPIDRFYVAQQKERQYAYKRILFQLKPLVITKGATLLDVGCSYGFFMKLAEESGYKVYGIELNRDANIYCKEKLNLKVFCGGINQVVFSDNYFDVITALEVIEHVQDLKGFITNVRRMLKPGGILYLVTPDRRSLSARLLGRKWWSYRRMHINYFSKKTLLTFLKNNGFHIISYMPYKKTFKGSYILYQLLQFDKLSLKVFDSLAKITKMKDRLITLSYGDIAFIAKKNLK